MHSRKQAPIIKSKTAITVWHIPAIITIAVIGWAAYIFMCDALSVKYVQLIAFGFAALLFCLAAYMLQMLFAPDVLLVYSNRLVVRSGLGYIKKTILFDDLVGYAEKHKEGIGGKYSQLILFTLKTSYLFYSYQYSNYKLIRAELATHAVGKQDLLGRLHKQSKIYKIAGLTLALAAVLYLAYYSHSHLSNNVYIAPNDLTIIGDQVVNEPAISGSKTSKSIHINLNGYPQFEFTLNDSYGATAAKKYVNNVVVGDSIWVGVSTTEYRQKITEDMPLLFWEKHCNYKFISVYSLRDTSRQYLTLAKYNSYRQQHPPFSIAWVLLLVAAVIVVTIVQDAKEYMRY